MSVIYTHRQNNKCLKKPLHKNHKTTRRHSSFIKINAVFKAVDHNDWCSATVIDRRVRLYNAETYTYDPYYYGRMRTPQHDYYKTIKEVKLRCHKHTRQWIEWISYKSLIKMLENGNIQKQHKNKAETIIIKPKKKTFTVNTIIIQLKQSFLNYLKHLKSKYASFILNKDHELNKLQKDSYMIWNKIESQLHKKIPKFDALYYEYNFKYWDEYVKKQLLDYVNESLLCEKK
eukprot:269908_1